MKIKALIKWNLMNLSAIKYYIISILLLCFPYISSAQGNAATLDDLIDEALKNNPEIEAAYYEWQAEKNKVKQISSLPDPVLSLGIFGSQVETKVGPQQWRLGLSQKIPFPGKLDLIAQIKLTEVDLKKLKYETLKLDITRDLKIEYYKLILSLKMKELLEQEKSILKSMEAVAKTKYESNLTPQKDVLMVNIQLSNIINDLIELEQTQTDVKTEIIKILNRSSADGISPVEFRKPEILNYSVIELLEIAENNSPDLYSAQIGIQGAQRGISLAEREYYPDFTVGLDYLNVGDGYTEMPDDGKDAWMFRVSLIIPLWLNKRKAMVAEKSNILAEMKSKYLNIRTSVCSTIEDLYSQLETYHKQLQLYEKTLLPQAEQVFESTELSYQTGKLDFNNWLEAERMWLKTKMVYYKTAINYQIVKSKLERVVGRSL